MASASTSAVLYATVVSASQLTGAVPEDASDLAHHAKGGKGFVNPWDSYREQSVPQILGALLWRQISGNANKPDTTPPTVPIRQPHFLPTRETSELRATWLGHACYYVEFPGGLRVLFDPVWEGRCGPMGWFGPKRYNDPPCRIEDLPAIDIVVISHAHYDHLSHPTVTKIKKLHPNVHFFAPLGNQKWFADSGMHNATELDWWQSRDIRLSPVEHAKPEVVETGGQKPAATDITATIECLPCQHMAARTPFDKAHTLWASWSITSGGKKVWFAGDTGYRTVPNLPKGEDDYGAQHQSLPTCPAFKQIGKLRGPFDLGLIPIGAYEPRFIMSPVHANPFDSVNIFADTQCTKALGMHWGTWVLTEEDVLEPPRLLKQALARKGIAEEGVFDVCDIGESRVFS
ncbi:N-acyl-phosphatidylethanolamine-hydrolyzing phospholipase D [Lasiodiplodia hormozganensis]|uniref:N-acyl-phosphatidylethanolamine-hydrolyzing phospholipase D n=1 Tax=Lasiodiplodia hormozganensis TaxID=869390 RepID=A0AA39Z1E0_9PEZI|nr:N-acyl-phosphatidylethanolamine-hydrolyzing phospholipase D [Lasiodiplodia hormozganensis]